MGKAAVFFIALWLIGAGCADDSPGGTGDTDSGTEPSDADSDSDSDADSDEIGRAHV